MEHSREWVKATLVYGQSGKIESCIKMVKTIFPEQVSHIQETVLLTSSTVSRKLIT